MTTDGNTKWHYPGARWWKFDFHTHTPASMDYGKGDPQSSLKQLEPKEWLLGYMRAEIDCVAVTDHNTGEWVDRLKQALDELEQTQHPEFRSLHLFPGVELSVNGGFHLLTILDTGSTTSDLDALIGAVDYDGSMGDSDGVTRKSAVEVVETVLAEAAFLFSPMQIRKRAYFDLRAQIPRKRHLTPTPLARCLIARAFWQWSLLPHSSRDRTSTSNASYPGPKFLGLILITPMATRRSSIQVPTTLG